MREHLGYACINMELSESGVSTNRGMIKRTYQAKGIDYAADLALLNLKDLLKVLQWNYVNKIKVYRMSSCLFPWMSEYEFVDLYNYPEILNHCQLIGKYAEKTGQRLSFHPGHFDILASPTESTVNNSILDLNRHAQIMDMMNLRTDRYNTINIHVGGAYGDKESAMKRFCSNFKKLQESAKQRLTVENDDKANMYSTKDLYDGVFKEVGIPIVFDFLHHTLCTGDQTEEEALKLAATTWPEGILQLTHFSSSKKIHEDSTSIQTAHAEYLYEFINMHGIKFDIEIEAKAKERALLSYVEKFVTVNHD
jgi:UV DNA damage endonuclease